MPTPRPLSPHLSIYRPQITSVLSITHRFTGAALTIGLLPLAVWLWSAAYNTEWFDILNGWAKTIWGMALLGGWSFAFYYHLANGIRHLFWDMGVGYTIPVLNRTGWMVVFFSFLATAVTWWYVLQQTPETL